MQSQELYDLATRSWRKGELAEAFGRLDAAAKFRLQAKAYDDAAKYTIMAEALVSTAKSII